MNIDAIMRTAPVIPVIVIEDVAHAVPLAEALVAGGLRVLEVTLRTPAALASITAMKQVPGAIVGAGTVTNPKELEAIRQREADITKEKIAKILAAGANVILTTKVCWRACVQLLPRCICFGVAIRLLTMMRVSVAPYGRVWSRALTMCA